MSNKKKPEEIRRDLYKKEQINNPAGNLNDQMNRVQSSMPNTSGMSLKEIGGIILFLIIFMLGYSMYKMFF
ncbi:DUF6366 family protein [Solibacillus silvestris]|uniref:DUF6366 family protein n=1 Tax=Solibacillus silvestris TaxID=76853 RepID=UPI003F811D38